MHTGEDLDESSRENDELLKKKLLPMTIIIILININALINILVKLI
jgi:hypothetical protein